MNNSRRAAGRKGAGAKAAGTRRVGPEASAPRGGRGRGGPSRAKGRSRDAIVLAGCLAALAVAGWTWAVRGGGAVPVDLGPIIVPDERPPAPLAPEVPPEIVRQLELDEQFIALERWTAEHPNDVADRITRWRELRQRAEGTPYATLAAPRLADAEAKIDRLIDGVADEVNAARRLDDWEKAEGPVGTFLALPLELSNAQRERLAAIRAETKARRDEFEGASFRMGVCTDPAARQIRTYGGMQILDLRQIAPNPSALWMVLFAPGVSRLAVGFDLDLGNRKAFIGFRHLETQHLQQLRFARITVRINDAVLATGIAPVNGEFQVIEVTSRIRPKRNVIEVLYDADSLTPCWLQRLEITDRP